MGGLISPRTYVQGDYSHVFAVISGTQTGLKS